MATSPIATSTPEKTPSKKQINWHKVGAIAGIVAIVVGILVPVYLYWVQRNDKAMAYGIISQGPLVSVKDDLRGRLKVLLDGKPVGSVNLIVIKLQNTGNVAIRKVDYDRPISINFGPDSQVLSGEIVTSRPSNLGETLKVSSQGITLDPVLFNKGDGLVVKAIVNTPNPNISLDGRIVDVDEIKKVDLVAPQQGRMGLTDYIQIRVVVQIQRVG